MSVDTEKNNLTGKVAVVTGGSRGIGRATALALAGRGANIALIYAGNEKKAEDTCEELRALGVKADSYKCDVGNFDDTKKTVAEIASDFGTVDILINNAGITSDALVCVMSEKAFDSVLDTNLKGAFNMIRHCYPIFMKKRSGKIINISSVAGLTGNAGQANYASSKAGLIGLTKSVARELASRGVCCNAIAPGFIDTDMTENLQKEKFIGMIPAGRAGKAEEVAELAVFLAGRCSDYITGEVIRVDGGMAM